MCGAWPYLLRRAEERGKGRKEEKRELPLLLKWKNCISMERVVFTLVQCQVKVVVWRGEKKKKSMAFD